MPRGRGSRIAGPRTLSHNSPKTAGHSCRSRGLGGDQAAHGIVSVGRGVPVFVALHGPCSASQRSRFTVLPGFGSFDGARVTMRPPDSRPFPIARSSYVILDISDDGAHAGQTAGLAERRGENAPFQLRSSGRSGIPAAQIAERRESWSAAFAANAIDWPAMPRTSDQRREPSLADCLSRCNRCCGDPRCVRQEDCCDAKRGSHELQKTPCSLHQRSSG